MRACRWTFASLLAYCTLAPAGLGQVVISEVMYNPDSQEGYHEKADQPASPTRTEWVELYNPTDAAVDLAGWVLKDDDGATGALPDGASIPAGGAVVIVPDAVTAEQFAAAWGGGITVYPVSGWADGGMNNLANNPDPGKEVLELLDADGNSVDRVAYDDEGDWPGDAPDGPSIYLVAGSLTAEANDTGTNWKKSKDGKSGAMKNTQTDIFDGEDVGSPGKVDTGEAEAE